ncbi:uncharacterized protein [Hoplias malabaricus]|uniref:uncharacterized protein n=1 Tax=Hoplias malabaricus TaxID=27720 RepID=UPI00346327CF
MELQHEFENTHTENLVSGKENKEMNDLRKENEILKSEINKLRTKFQDSQNEMHNFKERMGKVVDLKLGSSGVLSEDLTNPCRESELMNMYEKLKKNHWATLLRQLKGKRMSSEKFKEAKVKAQDQVKDILRQSQDDIQKITDIMKHLTPSSQQHNNNKNKTAQFLDLAIHNLQMAIYQEKSGIYSKDKAVPEEMCVLVDECYKIGCLLALHNPPLLLDFDSCEQGAFLPFKTVKFDSDEKKEEEIDDVPMNLVCPPRQQPLNNRVEINDPISSGVQPQIINVETIIHPGLEFVRQKKPDQQRQDKEAVQTTVKEQPEPHPRNKQEDLNTPVSVQHQDATSNKLRERRTMKAVPQTEDRINPAPLVPATNSNSQRSKDSERNQENKPGLRRPVSNILLNQKDQKAHKNMSCLCVILAPLIFWMLFVVCGIFWP